MVETDITTALAELGLIPVDWVHASQFAKLTGIPEQRLFARKENWPEDLVWTKQDGNIYYSIRGYNQWMTEQAEKRYRKACGLEMAQSKSTLNAANKPTTSRSPIRQLRKASVQPLKLEVS